jgi:hypothetical protein
MAKSARSSPLSEAWDFYERGDMVRARAAAQKLLATGPAPEVAQEANDLLSRTKIPALALQLAAVLAVLLGIMIAVGIAKH